MPCHADVPDQPSGSDLAAALGKISVDPAHSYRVRDLQLSRGDLKIYLNEGVLSFATPLEGRTVAAVFTTQYSEAGDAEVLLLPPQRSERASLASFINSPNLDEHFGSAVFLFADDTAAELLSQLSAGGVHPVPEASQKDTEVMNTALRTVVSESSIRLMEALLDSHRAQDGFFYASLAGNRLGVFDVFYEPSDTESITVGRPVRAGIRIMLQLWAAFRPRHAGLPVERDPILSDYHIDTTIRPDLSLSAIASFTFTAQSNTGRALAFGLSDHLRVKSATIDGRNAEISQPEAPHLIQQERGLNFLLVSQAPLPPGTRHQVEVRYEGSVIHQTGSGGYFVDERNVWYPYVPPMRTNFDLTFRFAPPLTLISTGDLVSDEVVNGTRVVHRRTAVPQGLAGFNLGDYKSSVNGHGLYRVESYAEQKSPAESPDRVARKTEEVLDYYTKLWIPLPIHALAVTPIDGTFGQGFPGLIYLSTLAYMRPEDRPANLRNARQDTFFSEMMLPHEVAHQWWGNGVIPADYRVDWLIEAMANYSALQVLEHTRGPKAVEAVLEGYRLDLLEQKNGRAIESYGPVDFGVRLIDSEGLSVWHKIVYEKGTWILHMLRQRLGDEGFRHMQVKLLAEFSTKRVSNEGFRQVASEFVPAGQPDKTLAFFFDTWVYGTGIPHLSLERTSKEVSLELAGVENDFIADVPLECFSKSGKPDVKWVRASSGSNPVNKTSLASCELPRPSTYLYSY